MSLSYELNRKLEAFKREASLKSGRFVSKSSLLEKIIEDFFEREEVSCATHSSE